MITVRPEDHFLQRIDVHPSQRQFHIQPVSQRLQVATCISNPERFYSRYRNYQAFAKHMSESGVDLYTVELALRDRHHEIEQTTEKAVIKLRSEHILWNKENLLNVAISRFDEDWHYGAWIDADFIMTRSDWCVEAIHELQKYDFVQLFSTYHDVMPDKTLGASMPSFMTVLEQGPGVRKSVPASYYLKMGPTGKLWGAPGGAWAFRREAFDAVGGLLDTCILGSADYHMAIALALQWNQHREYRTGSPGYVRSLDEWAERAKSIRGNIGVVKNAAFHLWHGPRSNRGYVTRSAILKDNAFDPYTDLSRDWQGVLRFNGNKPVLEQAVRSYFSNRREDEGVL